MLKTQQDTPLKTLMAATVGVGLLAACASGQANDEASLHSSLTDGDMDRASQALETAMESTAPGEAVTWQNPETGNSGTITPGNAFSANGQPCRDYAEVVTIDDAQDRTSSYACRNDDGVWVLPET